MDKRSDFWKPESGVHYVGVLPPVGDMGGSFFTIVPLHWGFSQLPVVCPKRAKVSPSCPLCDYAQKFQNAGKEQEAGKMWPRSACYMNIILLDKDGDPLVNEAGEIEVKIWSPGKDTTTKIFNAIERESPDEDHLIDITDLESGWTLRCKRTGKDPKDVDWDITCAKGGRTSIAEYEEFITGAQDLTKATPILPGEELKALLGEFGKASADKAIATVERPALASGEDEDDDDENIVTSTARVVEDDEEVDEKPVSNGNAKLEALLAMLASSRQVQIMPIVRSSLLDVGRIA